MAKLNLVLADSDYSYVEGLEGYIAERQFGKFNISSFTSRTCLFEYLSNVKEKVDILLVSEEQFSEDCLGFEIGLIVVLSDDAVDAQKYGNCNVIRKYQLGDSLVRNILHLYSQKNGKMSVPLVERKTRIVAVYSPIGGSGKTGVAYGGSVLSAERGLNSFYLNLENYPSTSLFFNCDSSHNISHIFYYLKTKKDLVPKIREARRVDELSGVHYFCPQDSTLELYDITSDEYTTLIEVFRKMDEYDVVFIDMSSEFDKSVVSILAESDDVLLVMDESNFTSVKIENFIREICFLNKAKSSGLMDKIIPIINRVGQNEIIDSIVMNFDRPPIYLPKSRDMYIWNDGKAIINKNSGFCMGLSVYSPYGGLASGG